MGRRTTWCKTVQEFNGILCPFIIIVSYYVIRTKLSASVTWQHIQYKYCIICIQQFVISGAHIIYTISKCVLVKENTKDTVVTTESVFNGTVGTFSWHIVITQFKQPFRKFNCIRMHSHLYCKFELCYRIPSSTVIDAVFNCHRWVWCT